MDKHAEGPTKIYVERARHVWATYAPLASLSAQAKVSITADEWRSKALEFGKVPSFCLKLAFTSKSIHDQAFVHAYSAEEVTTYIHIFVYHYGDYLQEYNSIEKFSNYALESKHSTLKRILRDCTSGFSRGEPELVRQELSTLIRLEKHDENEQEKKRETKRKRDGENEECTTVPATQSKTTKDRTWSSSSHALHPENKPYHISSINT